MVEYTYEEAVALLEGNLATARERALEVREDIDFVKDQITTAEVNVARVYNYDVVRRREERRTAAGVTA